jgi:hypothetical protein
VQTFIVPSLAVLAVNPSSNAMKRQALPQRDASSSPSDSRQQGEPDPNLSAQQPSSLHARMPDGASDEEAERQAEQRRRNALYSKRKYYKKKIEIEQLESRKFELTIANTRLKEDNARLESILEDAQDKIQLIETPGSLRGRSQVQGRSERSQRQRTRRQSQLPVNNLSDLATSSAAATRSGELAATMARATASLAPAAVAAERAASLSAPDLLAGLRNAGSLPTGRAMPGAAANALSQLSLPGLPPLATASLLPNLSSDDLRQRILRLQHEQHLLGSAPGSAFSAMGAQNQAASAMTRGLLAGDAQRAQTTMPPLGGYEALLLRSLTGDISQLGQSSLASQLPYFGSSLALQPSLQQQLLQQRLLQQQQQQLVSSHALLGLPPIGLVPNSDAERIAALLRERQLQAQLLPQVSQQGGPTLSRELVAALLQQQQQQRAQLPSNSSVSSLSAAINNPTNSANAENDALLQYLLERQQQRQREEQGPPSDPGDQRP